MKVSVVDTNTLQLVARARRYINKDGTRPTFIYNIIQNTLTPSKVRLMHQTTGAMLHSTFCTWVHHYTHLFTRIPLLKLMSTKPSILLENEKYYAALHSS